MSTPQPKGEQDGQGGLYRLCWQNPVTGQSGTCGPMSREQAAFLVHDEALCETTLRFWMEPLDPHPPTPLTESRRKRGGGRPPLA